MIAITSPSGPRPEVIGKRLPGARGIQTFDTVHRVAVKQLSLVIRRLEDDFFNAEKIARHMQTFVEFQGGPTIAV